MTCHRFGPSATLPSKAMRLPSLPRTSLPTTFLAASCGAGLGIVTFIALAQEKPVVWVSYVPLLPLALLLLTGLYLFALPYTTKWRSGRRAD